MLFPQSWHGEGKRVLFEGRSYVCPNEARLYLSRMYGDDYMEIPPVKKRKTHYPFYVVFSDGEEMIFEEPKQKVEYKDILS